LFPFSEVSIHIPWLHFFWVYGKAEHHGGSAWRSKVAHLTAARKQREKNKKGPESRYNF
jgi:hypothetical protein